MSGGGGQEPCLLTPHRTILTPATVHYSGHWSHTTSRLHCTPTERGSALLTHSWETRSSQSVKLPANSILHTNKLTSNNYFKPVKDPSKVIVCSNNRTSVHNQLWCSEIAILFLVNQKCVYVSILSRQKILSNSSKCLLYFGECERSSILGHQDLSGIFCVDVGWWMMVSNDDETKVRS